MSKSFLKALSSQAPGDKFVRHPRQQEAFRCAGQRYDGVVSWQHWEGMGAPCGPYEPYHGPTARTHADSKHNEALSVYIMMLACMLALASTYSDLTEQLWRAFLCCWLVQVGLAVSFTPRASGQPPQSKMKALRDDVKVFSRSLN